MRLFCPVSHCPNHRPEEGSRWYDAHGSYLSCGEIVQRYRCRRCGRTFSKRTLSIDYWSHRPFDYHQLITLFVSGFSLRGLSRYFSTTVKTVQNRFGRLARAILPALSEVQRRVELSESLVADGLENFFVSQDFPNNIHLLLGKQSQYVYGLNYALMRRKGRKTEKQKRRCERLYRRVDFTRHTITGGFTELIEQIKRLGPGAEPLRLYTDEKQEYLRAIEKDGEMRERMKEGSFAHVRISSRAPRTRSNDLFSANYLDREIRKDLPEYHRETVCFGRNVGNGLERLCVYVYHHNFVKRYRIGVAAERRTHAEVAGLSKAEVRRIRQKITEERQFIEDGQVVAGSFFDQLWRRTIPTPLKEAPDYLPRFAVV